MYFINNIEINYFILFKMPRKKSEKDEHGKDIILPKTYILLDISYFIFYRYYALIGWWKLAMPDDELGIPIENDEFVKKFKKTFIDKIKEIPKKLKIMNYEVIAASDCSKKDIWRHQLFDKYKENRVYEDDFLGGPFFKLGFDILNEMNIKRMCHPHLEADDCIAITAKKLLSTESSGGLPCNILIVANDMDYLQLSCPRITLMNLKYKYLTDNKKWSGIPEKDLFCKIVMGDKSDNIPSIFKKCGPKTAEKCYEDREYFKDLLKKEDAEERYMQNTKLVDFNEIPDNLIQEFLQTYNDLFNSPFC
jgi:5'-3' exonuclease